MFFEFSLVGARDSVWCKMDESKYWAGFPLTLMGIYTSWAAGQAGGEVSLIPSPLEPQRPEHTHSVASSVKLPLNPCHRVTFLVENVDISYLSIIVQDEFLPHCLFKQMEQLTALNVYSSRAWTISVKSKLCKTCSSCWLLKCITRHQICLGSQSGPHWRGVFLSEWFT